MTIQEAFVLAVRQFQAGRRAEAESLCRHILAARPDHADAMNLLACVAAGAGQYENALEWTNRAVALQPKREDFLRNQGAMLGTMGRAEEAAAAYRQALLLRSDIPETHFGLGNALVDAGQWEQAIEAYRRAVALRPGYAEAMINLANALRQTGRLQESIRTYRSAIECRPDIPEGHSNLGNALREAGQLDEAIAACRQALAFNPNHVDALNNLGNALKDAGQIGEAIAAYRRAASLRPESPAYNNLLYALNFQAGLDPKEILEEHRRWDQACARRYYPKAAVHSNSRDPNRRLKMGYVSPDFREHAVGRFLLPLLENHDHSALEIFCYSDVRLPDAMTARLRSCADQWRQTPRWSDERLAQGIREDGIDILVDLAMHAAGSRLLALARKPAPVQMAYLAYPGTTGLGTMDYRLTDPYLDPPEADVSCYFERSYRLPRTYWCYQPPAEAADLPVSAPPVESSGRITFGCLSSFNKVTPPVIELWAGVLRATEKSRLILHAPLGSHRRRVHDQFSKAGLDPARVEFVARQPLADYFRQYQAIDIVLDTFPHAGGTTTCDALWMGVPVITLAGPSAVGRGGVGLLSNVGLPDLIGHTPAEYRQIATELAGNVPRLAALRAQMRDRMQRSPLMDAPQLTRDIEAAYRAMWREWCVHEQLP